MNDEAVHPAVRVGPVHLRVADLYRALGFYRDALGFGLIADGREVGLDAAFLAAPTTSDHGASISVYLSDPDGNGVELYCDRPRAAWFDADGRPILKAERFDYRELL